MAILVSFSTCVYPNHFIGICETRFTSNNNNHSQFNFMIAVWALDSAYLTKNSNWVRFKTRTGRAIQVLWPIGLAQGQANYVLALGPTKEAFFLAILSSGLRNKNSGPSNQAEGIGTIQLTFRPRYRPTFYFSGSGNLSLQWTCKVSSLALPVMG